MTSYAVKLGMKQFNKYAGHKVHGKEDPFKEEIVTPDGKKQKVWRDIPEFIPEHDRAILAKVKERAYKADMGSSGIGWDGIVGFILPEIGDMICLAYALVRIYWTCTKVEGGLPSDIRKKMLSNIVIDALVGLIPFFGDIFDIFWKCNTKNVVLLEKHLRKKYGPADKQARHSAGLHFFDKQKGLLGRFVGTDAGPETHDWNDLDEERDDRLAAQANVRTNKPLPPDPQPYQTQPTLQQKQTSGWGNWSRFGRGDRQPDAELGHAPAR